MALIDKVSGPGKTIQGALAGINRAVAGMAGGMINGPAAAIGRMNKSLQQNAAAMAPLGAAATVGLIAAGRSAIESERNLNAAMAAGDLSIEERDAVMKNAVKLNYVYGGSVNDVVAAHTELLRSGVNLADSLEILPSAMNLAQATGDQAVDVVRAMVVNMSALRLEAGKSTRVVDLFAQALDRTAGVSLNDFETSGKYFNPIAALAGLDPEETMAMQVEFAKRGLFGSSAGTGLRAGPAAILSPSEKSLVAMGQFGIDPSKYIGRRTGEAGIAQIVGVIEARGVEVSEEMEAGLQLILNSTRDSNERSRQIVTAFGDELGLATAADRTEAFADFVRAFTAGASEVDLAGFLADSKAAGAGVGFFNAVFGKNHGSKWAGFNIQSYLEELGLMRTEAVGAADRKSAQMMHGVVGDLNEAEGALQNLIQAAKSSGILSDASRALGSFARSLDAVASSSPGLLRVGVYSAVALAALPALGFAATGTAAAMGLLLNPITLVGGALAGIIALNWTPLRNGFRAFSAFLRRDLSPSIAARLGRVRAGLSGMVQDLGGGSGMKFNGMAARMGSALAGLANGANAAAPGIARFAREFAGDKIAALQDAGSAVADFAQRAGPAFSPAFAAALRLVGESFHTMTRGAAAWGRIGGGVLRGAVDFGRSFAEGIDIATIDRIGRGLSTAFGVMADAARPLAGLFDQIRLDTSSAATWGALAAKGFNQIVLEFSQMPDAINAEITRYKGYLAGMAAYVPSFSGIMGAIGSLVAAINSIATAVGNAISALNRLPTDLGMIGRSFDNSGKIPTGDPLGNLPAQTVPGRWSGGPVRQGHVYRINERGQELFAPGRNGQVIPANKLGGGGKTVVIHNHFGVVGDPQAAARMVAKMVNGQNDRASARMRQTAFDRPVN